MAGVRIALLGGVFVEREGDSRTRVSRSKLAALLVLLASPVGKPHERAALCAVLWPDRSDEQARHSLRQALTEVRQLLDAPDAPVLRTDGDVISLDPSHVTTDIAELERLIAANADLGRAADLAARPLALGLGGVSAAFDDWLIVEQARVFGLAADALERVMLAAQASGDRDAAVRHARDLAKLEPVNEAAQRVLIAALVREGDITGARRQFELLSKRLRTDLDAAPEPETLELMRRIDQPNDTPEAPPAASAPTERYASRRAALRAKLRKLRARRRQWIAAFAATAIAVAAIAFFAPWPRNASERTGEAALACAPSGVWGGDREPTLMIMPLTARSANEALLLTDAARTAADIVPGISVIEGPPAGHSDLDEPRVAIAQRYGVTHLLDGRLTESANGALLALRMLDGRNGEVVWSATRRLTARAARNAGDSVGVETMRGVQEVLSDGAQTLAYQSYRPENLEILEHNTHGYSYLAQGGAAPTARALDHYRAALALDPNDAGALNGMAWARVNAVLFGWSANPEADRLEAAALARRSLAQNASHPHVHIVLSVLALLDGDHARAAAEASEALERGGGADANLFAALVATYGDHPETAWPLAERGLRLRPYASPRWAYWIAGRAARMAGHPEQALACLERSGAVDTPIVFQEAIAAHYEADDIAEARTLAGLAERTFGAGFTAQEACTTPPRARGGDVTACVQTLTAAGAPRGR